MTLSRGRLEWHFDLLALCGIALLQNITWEVKHCFREVTAYVMYAKTRIVFQTKGTTANKMSYLSSTVQSKETIHS